MADKAHQMTDAMLEDLEKRIAEEYAVASRDMQRKLREYFEQFEAQEAVQKALLDAGKITQEDYNNWRFRHEAMGKRWEQMKDVLAQDLENAQNIALKIAGEKMPDVYALNANYAAWQIEHGAGIDAGFTLYSHDTAEYLLKDTRQLMPGPSTRKAREIAANKAMQWNKGKIQSAVLQGILQGEGPYKVAERLRGVAQMDYNASVRYARTMTTSAQNAGRYESFRRAEKLGVHLSIEWQATLDSRTRHDHRLMHGQRTTVDKPFHTPDGFTIYYPADCSGSSDAPQREIWNCRCTLLAWVKGFEHDTVKESPKMEGMSFEEWQKEKAPKVTKNSDPIMNLERKGITVDLSGAGKYEEAAIDAVRHLDMLSDEYKADVVSFKVVKSKYQEGGLAYMSNGKTAISVSAHTLRINKATDKLKLGDKQPLELTYHEFAHAFSQTRQTGEKDKAFWSEIRKIRNEYSAQRNSEDWFSDIKISSYADKDVDEFMAEAFTQAKLSSNPSPYALRVLKIIDKYFRK